MFNDGGYYMGGMHGVWWLFWLVMIGVFLFFGGGLTRGRRPRSSDTPREMLERRLASGEITPEDYEKRKVLLDRDAGMKS